MRTRWIIGGVAMVALLAVATGIAYAAGTGNADANTPGASGLVTACVSMHDSPTMRAMHAQMPEALQAQCDAMHAQMANVMGGTGMMGGAGMMVGTGTTTGSGMMGGTGMMGDAGGSMAAHHASTGG